MKSIFVGLVWLVGLCRLVAAEALPHVEDAGGLLTTEAGWMKHCDARLAEFEHKTGIRILVQFHLKSPAEAEDARPGAYMHALARQLGVDRDGVLVVYFHDDPDWRVWIGDGLANIFTGRPGTVEELTESDAIHNVKEAMLTAVRAKAAVEIERAEKSASDKKPLPAAQRLVIQTDALFAALTAKFTKK